MCWKHNLHDQTPLSLPNPFFFALSSSSFLSIPFLSKRKKKREEEEKKKKKKKRCYNKSE